MVGVGAGLGFALDATLPERPYAFAPPRSLEVDDGIEAFGLLECALAGGDARVDIRIGTHEQGCFAGQEPPRGPGEQAEALPLLWEQIINEQGGRVTRVYRVSG